VTVTKVLLAASIIVLSVAMPAMAQQPAQGGEQVTCADFAHHANGMWSPLRPITITSPNGASATLGPGASFGTGAIIAGVPLAQNLNASCLGKSPEQ
jgi:hypothetical protein